MKAKDLIKTLTEASEFKRVTDPDKDGYVSLEYQDKFGKLYWPIIIHEKLLQSWDLQDPLINKIVKLIDPLIYV